MCRLVSSGPIAAGDGPHDRLPASVVRADHSPVASGVVLIPGAPLLAATLTVNVIATLLMAPARLFLLRVNDREIMGDLANGWRANLVGGPIVVALALVLSPGVVQEAVTAVNLSRAVLRDTTLTRRPGDDRPRDFPARP